jgi:hypothetical protein
MLKMNAKNVVSITQKETAPMKAKITLKVNGRIAPKKTCINRRKIVAAINMTITKSLKQWKIKHLSLSSLSEPEIPNITAIIEVSANIRRASAAAYGMIILISGIKPPNQSEASIKPKMIPREAPIHNSAVHLRQCPLLIVTPPENEMFFKIF